MVVCLEKGRHDLTTVDFSRQGLELTVKTVGILRWANKSKVSFQDETSSWEHPELNAMARSGLTNPAPSLFTTTWYGL